jgi:hypothetical protein
MRRSPTAGPASSVISPSYGAAVIASALTLTLYILTLAPSTAMWDTSEYIAAAYVLGIPHPPGNPFFVLLAHVAGLLPIAPAFATRVNVLAAVCSAASAGMWFLITERVLVGWLPARWQRILGGSLAVLIGATAFTVWNQSVVNEKVYTVSLLFFAIVSWLTVRWCDDPEGPKADRLLILVAYLIGLGYANHPAGFLVGPAVAVAVLVRRPATLLRWRLLLGLAGALALGLTPFIFEPIRAAHFPAINEGEATACTTHFTVSCTLNKVTFDRLAANIDRDQYGKPDVADRQAPFTAQVGMWWLYFKWQWLRDPHNEHPRAQLVLATVFLLLGAFGGYTHWKYDRRSFWFFAPLVGTVTLGLIYYLNFKYGYSENPELGNSVAREVRDRDYFYLWSFSTWSVWAALGLMCLWESLATIIAANRPRGWILAMPVLGLAFVPGLANWRSAPRTSQVATRDFAKDLLDSVEPYGTLVTVGDNDLFPLWYAQEVEGIRKDVLVITTSLLNTDWYPRQVIRRPIYAYDSLKGPAIYRGHTWTRPTGPALRMTLDEANAVPEYSRLPGPVVFHKPGTNLVARIDPAHLPYGGLLRADVFVLHLIADTHDRPTYISVTAGNYGEELGLGDHLLAQGLARKVLDDPIAATPDTVNVPGVGWFDTSRSLSLWDMAAAPPTLLRHPGWVDRASVNIPEVYVLQGVILSEALRTRHGPGDTARAAAVLAKSERLADAMDLGALFAPAFRPTLPSPSTDAPPRVELTPPPRGASRPSSR